MVEIVDEIGQVVRRYVPTHCHMALDDPDAPLASLGIDSLKMVALILDIERTLVVRFKSGVLLPENFETLKAAADTVARARHAADEA